MDHLVNAFASFHKINCTPDDLMIIKNVEFQLLHWRREWKARAQASAAFKTRNARSVTHLLNCPLTSTSTQDLPL